MLKRHQACIDLAKDALVIQGREIKFLSEHELPKAFQGDDNMELDEFAPLSSLRLFSILNTYLHLQAR